MSDATTHPAVRHPVMLTAEFLGRAAYEADCRAKPLYHDGTKRPAWDALWSLAQWSWIRNPTVPE